MSQIPGRKTLVLCEGKEDIERNHGGTLHEKERFAIWSIAAQEKSTPRQRLSIPRAIEHLSIDWSSPAFDELREILRSTAAPS